MKLSEKQLKNMINEAVKGALNEIGDTPKGREAIGKAHAKRNKQMLKGEKVSQKTLDLYNDKKDEWDDEERKDYDRGVMKGMFESKIRNMINKKVRQVINEGVEEDYRIYEEQLALQIFGMPFLDFYSKGGLFHTEEDLAKMSEYFDRLSTWREENNYKGRGF